jgi:4-amino-4-deoxy-L-arabinose transferase-like glycosyltransferase
MSPDQRIFPTHSPRFALAAGLVFVLILLTLAIRILSPSDIASRDQSRTVSYTIDMVRNGNLLLASDADGLPAIRPPLVNYLSALLVAPFGPNEWTFMAPSLLAFFATLALIYLIARDLFAQIPPPHGGWLGLTAAEWAALLAVTFFGLSALALRLAFVARPDMVLVFFLTLSFYAANRALALQPSQGAGWALVFWLAAGLAALARGPIALIPVLYGFVAAKFLHGGWGAAQRLRPAVGAPVSLVVALAWPVAVYVLAPEDFRNIVDQALGGQFEGAWYSGLISAWKVPLWMIAGFVPWSLLLLVAAWFFPWRQWPAHPLAPLLLYVLLLTIPFILVGIRRGEHFAPFLPPIAVICAWAAVYCWRGQVLLRTSVAAVPAMIVGLIVYFHFLSDPAKDLSGQRMLDFVHEVKAKADGRPLLFCKTANRELAVQAFLGVNQRGQYPQEAPEAGGWVVAEGPGDQPDALIESEPIPLIEGQRLYVALAEGGSPVCEGGRDRTE